MVTLNHEKRSNQEEQERVEEVKESDGVLKTN